jgi:predicted RNase H-like HicB family nuclease
MQVPIWIEQRDGKYIATCPSEPGMREEATTRNQAMAQIVSRLDSLVKQRELVMVNLPGIDEKPRKSLSQLAGSAPFQE